MASASDAGKPSRCYVFQTAPQEVACAAAVLSSWISGDFGLVAGLQDSSLEGRMKLAHVRTAAIKCQNCCAGVQCDDAQRITGEVAFWKLFSILRRMCQVGSNFHVEECALLVSGLSSRAGPESVPVM